MNNNIVNFINNLEKIYENINIYRAIILINDIKKEELLLLENELKKNNHNPLIINNKYDINYNYRLFIIKDISIINNLKKENFNFIFIYQNNIYLMGKYNFFGKRKTEKKNNNVGLIVGILLLIIILIIITSMSFKGKKK